MIEDAKNDLSKKLDAIEIASFDVEKPDGLISSYWGKDTLEGDGTEIVRGSKQSVIDKMIDYAGDFEWVAEHRHEAERIGGNLSWLLQFKFIDNPTNANSQFERCYIHSHYFQVTRIQEDEFICFERKFMSWYD